MPRNIWQLYCSACAPSGAALTRISVTACLRPSQSFYHEVTPLSASQHPGPSACVSKCSFGWLGDVFSVSFSFWSWITLVVSIHTVKKKKKKKQHYTVAKKMKCSKCNFAIEILDRWLFLIWHKKNPHVKSLLAFLLRVSDHCSYRCWRNYRKPKTSLRGWLNTTPMRGLIA